MSLQKVCMTSLFCVKKIKCQKTISVSKNVVSKKLNLHKILDQKNLVKKFGPKKFLTKKSFWCKKNLVSSKIPKEIFSLKHFIWNLFSVSKKMLVPKKILCPKMLVFGGKRGITLRWFGVIALWSKWSLPTKSWPQKKPTTLQKVFNRWVVHNECFGPKLWF